MVLWSLPDVLIIQLKRFSFRNNLWRDKINDLITYPIRLVRFFSQSNTQTFPCVKQQWETPLYFPHHEIVLANIYNVTEILHLAEFLKRSCRLMLFSHNSLVLTHTQRLFLFY